MSSINEEFATINCLIEAANKGDRFHLLNDPNALPGNLTNPVHPLFHSSSLLERTPCLKQALQLASLFLSHDSTIEFFVPLTYGRYGHDAGLGKTYLSDPLADKSFDEMKPYFQGVRKALHCLAHCVTFRWIPLAERLWARTVVNPHQASHAPECSNAFLYDQGVLIEMNDKLLAYYVDEQAGYLRRSRCDQFRHDFQFAVTLVHEIVHAYGAMRRGHLKEPYVRIDHPSTEWGYAWENFMFGCIVNPQDKTRHGTHIQLRKTWACPEVEHANRGKEYAAVSAAWVAQWFRTETWKVVEIAGPLAIPPPVVHVKFTVSSRFCRFFVKTDRAETREDIEDLRDRAAYELLGDQVKGISSTRKTMELSKTMWVLQESEELQQSNVPIPSRVPKRENSLFGVRRLSVSVSDERKHSVSDRTSSTTSTNSLPVIDKRAKRVRDDEDVDYRDIDYRRERKKLRLKLRF